MVIDFGVAQGIEAGSAGSPGQRTFHLRILGEAGQSAALKLEKEHLVGLRTGLRELLAQIGHQETPEVRRALRFPRTADHDFPAGALGIGFSSEDGTIVLEVRELEDEEEESPDATTIRVRFAPSQGASLATQMEEIIGAGRPICPLCLTPIDPGGHVCVKSNGHSQQPIPREPRDQE
jgi:uncharacterized repeat protein (TIGR03847 family)